MDSASLTLTPDGVVLAILTGDEDTEPAMPAKEASGGHMAMGSSRPGRHDRARSQPAKPSSLTPTFLFPVPVPFPSKMRGGTKQADAPRRRASTPQMKRRGRSRWSSAPRLSTSLTQRRSGMAASVPWSGAASNLRGSSLTKDVPDYKAWHVGARQRISRQEKNRLNLLKIGDQVAYMKMVEESKNERLKMLLDETDELLEETGKAVQRQKDVEHVSQHEGSEVPKGLLSDLRCQE